MAALGRLWCKFPGEKSREKRGRCRDSETEIWPQGETWLIFSLKPTLQVQREERDSCSFTWTPWWLRSPFHLHELPRAPHRPSLMLGWLSFWQITAIFMAWYPPIYGLKEKKKKNRRLKYQPFISVTSSHPLSFLPAQPLVRQHLTVARTPGTQGAEISAWSQGNPWTRRQSRGVR